MRRLLLCGVACVAFGCSDLPTEPESPPLETPELQPAAALTAAVPPYTGCMPAPPGTLPSGALYTICFPPDWNGDVVYWAHGYVSPFAPLALPDDEVDGTPISNIVLGLRFAYATTSYRANGLVAVDAVGDLVELAQAVQTLVPDHRFDYLVGGSEGGLATALALERQPAAFDGGVIACAPTGTFRGQVRYFFDVRAVFDVLFPGILPGSATDPPADLIANWETTYAPAVQAALIAQPGRTAQLLNVVGIAVDPNDPSSAVTSVLAALWYNVYATDDAREKLGGVPVNNRYAWYSGSANDFLLNLRVERTRGDAAALAALDTYEANGRLRRPAQGIHTRYDPIIPYWQAQIYSVEALFGSGLRLLSVPSDNYGHCAFDAEEVLASFAILVLRVTGANLLASSAAFPQDASIARFQRLAAGGGAQPEVWTPEEIASALARR